MSADFTTTLNVKGSKEECLEIMKVLCHYANDRQEQYMEKRDCWYLDESLESPEEELNEKWASGKMSIILSGPYGIFSQLEKDIDLFERIADAAPACCFFGSITGWDAGGDQSLVAELKDGLLYLRSFYGEYGDETDEDENAEVWDTIYDPKAKKYSQFSHASEGDSVVVTISLLDQRGVKYELSLPSDVIEDPINLYCWPEDFLSDKSVDNIFNILLNTIDGEGAEKRKKDIIAFRTEVKSELENNGLSKLELTKTHDHKAPFFFGWLRANVLYPEMKKLANKVCTCAEKNRQKNIEEFENYLNTFKPWFPVCEWTGWPEFCIWHHREDDINPNYNDSVKLDWSCLADSVEEFAKYICSKEEPKEYAVERVVVDFEAGTTEQTAIYMPRGTVH